ncbi:MAG: SHOCT domain-containing protein [Acidobacteria bacterium]|nr:SHOCT domain-containing protein [Acidobacteriota bacterium]
MGPEYLSWGGMWMMWFFPLVTLGVILLLVYLIFGKGGFRASGGHMDERHSYRQESETPLDILKRRYATGEITKEQYAQMRQDIS